MIDVEQIRDTDQLRQVAVLLQRENEKLHRRLEQLACELALTRREKSQGVLELELHRLQQQMDVLQRRMFGDSSERRPRKQDEAKHDEPRRGHGPRPQPALPIVEQVHELSEQQRVCPSCAGRLEPLGDSFEESEEVSVVQRRFVMVKHRRRKYRCRCQSAVVTAPGPAKVIEGGRYSLDFAIEVAVAKYADHLPLDRQRRMMAREGLVVETQTIWDQIEALAQVLRRTYDTLHARVLDAPAIHADETWWRLWRRRPTKRWWVWTLASEQVVYHRLNPSRSSEVIRELLGDYQGIVLTDGYGAYNALARAGPQRRLAHCWAHVRRKYLEAEPHYPAACGEALEMIRELYKIERGLPAVRGVDGEDLDRALALRRRIRDEQSRPIVDELLTWACAQRATPESSLRKAVNYMLGLWPGLTLFLAEPQIEIDNNHVERQLRGVVLGRKNHYGSRSRRGTEVAALFYSLIDTARLHGVDPRHYLREATLAGLKRPAEVLLPRDLLDKNVNTAPAGV